jgi:hypothetical protein
VSKLALVLGVFGLAWIGLDLVQSRPSVGAFRYANEVLAGVIAFAVLNAVALLRD